MASLTIDEYLDTTARGAKVFVESFYEIFDNRRQEASIFYTDNAKLVWNGHPHMGKEAVAKMFQLLPSSKHTILSFDSQPIFASQEKLLLVVVTGTVTYGEKETHTFTQDFFLVPKPQNQNGVIKEIYFISNDEFRFV